MRALCVWLLFLSPLGAQEAPKVLPPKEAKAAFLKLLDRPKVPADVKQISDPKKTATTLMEHFSIATEKKADGTIERVPVLLVRPAAKGKYPAIIVLHGTGGTKESQRQWLDDFAARGIIGVAIDARYHGERAGGAKGSTAYVTAITKAWRTPTGQPHEHPFFYDTVYDLWRVLDYLETRADVDAKRLGMTGTSMGGIQTYLAASVDDRVKVAAPLIGIQSFRWSLDNDRWQGRAKTIQATHDVAARDLGETKVTAKVCEKLWGKIIPGITTDYDCTNLLPLFADRALFIANGTQDPNCPIEGTRLAIAQAEAAFKQANNSERLQVLIEDVAHTVTPKARTMTLDFCTKWLTK